jgi:nucleotide-binding universal stress UspA family protein
MFNKILVPLDGSKLAECAVEYTINLAQKINPEKIVLISVTESVKGTSTFPELSDEYRSSQKNDITSYTEPPSSFIQHPAPVHFGTYSNYLEIISPGKESLKITFGKMEKQAYRYLRRIAKKLESKNLPCEIQVLIGTPAEQIIKFIDNSGIDLVIMSTHGRTGITRWAYGSVADKVMRAVSVPVMVIRPPGCSGGA